MDKFSECTVLRGIGGVQWQMWAVVNIFECGVNTLRQLMDMFDHNIDMYPGSLFSIAQRNNLFYKTMTTLAIEMYKHTYTTRERETNIDIEIK